MKKLFLLPFLLTINLLLYAQTLAITEFGDTVYIYDNGTWSFEIEEDMPALPGLVDFLDIELTIDTLHEPQFVTDNANKEVRNLQEQYFIKYDGAKWKRVPPASLNEDAEFAFQSKTEDIWCVVIWEETVIDKEAIFKIAKNMMEENVGSPVKIVQSEVRTVNGSEVLHGVLATDFSGIKFHFDTYYYSDDRGTIQFTTWTSDALWERSKDKIEELLNGLHIVIQ